MYINERWLKYNVNWVVFFYFFFCGIDWLYLYVYGLCIYNLFVKSIVIDWRNLDCVIDIISNMLWIMKRLIVFGLLFGL